MKKIINLLLVFILIILSCNSVFSLENISFETSDCISNCNRLVTVQMKAKGNLKLSAGSFEITYDNSLLEYRSVKTDDDSEINVNNIGNKIKVIYLNTYGKDIKKTENLFSITFKTINSGKCHLDFSVYDLVDSNVKSINVGNCVPGKITINGNNKVDKTTTQNKNNSNGKSDITYKKRIIKSTVPSSVATTDEWGNLLPSKDNSIKFLFVGLGIGFSVMLIIIIIATIVKKMQNNKKQIENENSADS